MSCWFKQRDKPEVLLLVGGRGKNEEDLLPDVFLFVLEKVW